MAAWGGAEYAAVCSNCLAHRTEIASEVLAQLCEGKRRTQIDCGNDVVFGGITPSSYRRPVRVQRAVRHGT
jgi:hypothetical protein